MNMCEKRTNTCCKWGSAVFVALAVIMGILACVLAPSQLGHLLVIAKFFDVMLPILGAGALIKYLFSRVH